jgi:hypothetical protein
MLCCAAGRRLLLLALLLLLLLLLWQLLELPRDGSLIIFVEGAACIGRAISGLLIVSLAAVLLLL